MDFQKKAKYLVVRTFNENAEKTDDKILSTNEVFVVWFSKTLHNWKALLSTTVSDGKYYEVTYNGEFEETYVDTYVKLRNEAYDDYDEDIEEATRSGEFN